MATITRTARQMVRGALRLIGVGGEGEDLGASQENDAFEILNEWLASQESAFQHVITRESFTLSTTTSIYQIGSGATWDTDRPNRILGGYIRKGTQDYQVRVMSRHRWMGVWRKGASGDPTGLYYRPSYPNGLVCLDLVPSAADTIYLDLDKPIGSISSLDTTLSLPPEYYRAIRYNLAVHVAPEYERSVSREVAMIADDALMALKRRNVANDIVELDVDPVLQPHGGETGASFGAGGVIVVLDGDGNEFEI